MKPLAARDPFKIGLVAILIGALLGLVVVGISVIPFGKKSYTAILAQTAGLRVSEDVKVHGVPVGQIKGIKLDGDQVKVTFTVSKDVRLGSKTTAAVKVATLLGTHYLDVKPLGSGEISRIPLSRTSVPYNLQDVLEKGTGTLQKLDPLLLAKALTEASKTLDATTEGLGPALNGVARLSEAVTARSTQTAELFNAARKITDQLGASSVDIVDLMKQSTLVLNEINSRRAAIHTLLTETTALAQNLAGIIDDTQADLGPAFRKLNQVLSTLRSQDKVLKDLLDNVAPAVRYVANATGNGPWGDLFVNGSAIPPDDVRCRTSGDC
ncbi:MCE family protein [Nocardioides marmorisolisilvae]|uniref:MCE family protein n=1 Tax=Nocardioides marmorisolisilvae TaxID=1542737 RepID=UPI00161647D9|nr:MlaD family protein [Nocardioides marmorisolisilvae]